VVFSGNVVHERIPIDKATTSVWERVLARDAQVERRKRRVLREIIELAQGRDPVMVKIAALAREALR
jgi:hypothetical protein